MTSPDCASGTDRVAEVARKLPQADILVNVQGDEPEMSPDNIDRVIELLEQNPSAGMATLATPLRIARAARQPGLRESRVRRPRPRAVLQPQPDPVRPRPCRLAAQRPSTHPPIFFQHLGIYAYRRDDAARVRRAAAVVARSRPRSSSSCACCNRAATILVGVVEHAASGIDTPADYAAFVARHAKKPLAA